MKPGAAAAESDGPKVAAFSAKKSPAELQEEVDRLTKRVAELEAELAAKK